jgi:uncharacterized protein YbgA (DUF1722 family)/uncharacterized protein YbbK (DUF523 family)
MGHVEFVPVCPEVEIGLGVPRETIRLVNSENGIRLMEPATGNDYTDRMVSFADSFSQNNQNIDGFILKSRSPSCGIYGVKVYPTIEKSPVAFGDKGLFTSKIKELLPGIPAEEEGRLTNAEIREHFLTSVYTIAHFRSLNSDLSKRKLIEFHTRHKFLFMMYNQSAMRDMGRLLGNMKDQTLKETATIYFQNLLRVFAKKPSKKSASNVLMHAMGYFSKKLSSSEKKHFLKHLDEFVNRYTPISVLNGILGSWINRFNEDYLSKQSFFKPFPEELVTPLNSSKGRTID